MKKTKTKSVKSPSKRSAAEAVPEPELPNLVTAMTKLVERLEIVERKMDQVLGRVLSLPSEVRNAVQQSQGRPSSSQPSHSGGSQHSHSPQPPRPAQNTSSSHGQGQSQGGPDHRRERPMYQAVCADCQKSCEVPFKPSDRPVYCKECFSARKSSQKAAPSLSPRSIASSYVNTKAGYPSKGPASYRPQGNTLVSGNTAVLKPEKNKPAARSEKVKTRKKK